MKISSIPLIFKSFIYTVIPLSILFGITGCQTTSGSQLKETTKVAKEDKTQPLDFQSYDAKTFYDSTSIMGNAFNKDGNKILISSDETGIFNLYEIDLNTKNKQHILQSNETTYPVRYFPQDDRILFTRDSGGNELFHVYVKELDGTITDLTPGEKVRASFYKFTSDEKFFYILSNARDSRFMDLYRINATTYESELIYENNNNLNIGSISQDGRLAALFKVNSNKDTDLYLMDLNDPKQTLLPLAENEGEAKLYPRTFSVDAQYLYYSTDAHGEFKEIWRYSIKTQEYEQIISADWDVSFLYFSESGRYRVSGIDVDASIQIQIQDTQTGENLDLPKLPEGKIHGVRFSEDDTLMAFYLSSDTSPINLYLLDVKTHQLTQLTDTLNKKINPQHLVESQVVRFKSFDDLEIPGILYKPKQAQNQEVPALIWVHGGPGGQSRKGYTPLIQHLVNHGYAIFAVNNRGSSGYGKTFFHLDDRKHGEDDLQDIIYGKKHLQFLDWVNSEKIGIIGGSYGGYIVTAALAFTPDEFEVGIDIFGVTNWVRTLTSIPPWWESFKKSLYDEMGDPATDGERHKAISSLFHADNIKKPLLVVQGANDPRVLQVESDELVAAVKKNNVPVEYVLFPDEGHGFTKRKNRITASDKYLNFLQKHLPTN